MTSWTWDTPSGMRPLVRGGAHDEEVAETGHRTLSRQSRPPLGPPQFSPASSLRPERAVAWGWPGSVRSPQRAQAIAPAIDLLPARSRPSGSRPDDLERDLRGRVIRAVRPPLRLRRSVLRGPRRLLRIVYHRVGGPGRNHLNAGAFRPEKCAPSEEGTLDVGSARNRRPRPNWQQSAKPTVSRYDHRLASE